jgi:hypothetical protein
MKQNASNLAAKILPLCYSCLFSCNEVRNDDCVAVVVHRDFLYSEFLNELQVTFKYKIFEDNHELFLLLSRDTSIN